MLDKLIGPVTGLLSEFIEDKDKANALAAEISTLASRQATELALAQIKLNTEDAKGNWFQSSWRPATAWVCLLGFLVNFLISPIAAPFVISALMDSLSFTHVACTFAGLYVFAAISTLFLPIATRGRAIVETASNVNGEMNEENESDGILLLAPCRTVYDHQKKTKENEGRKENDVL